MGYKRVGYSDVCGEVIDAELAVAVACIGINGQGERDDGK
jgi:hypothetical protein